MHVAGHLNTLYWSCITANVVQPPARTRPSRVAMVSSTGVSGS
jgi:hypothetical protein